MECEVTMSSKTEDRLINTLKDVINLVENSNIKFVEYGVFGSAARGDYKPTSDLDIVLIVENLDEKELIANLKWQLDDYNCDLVMMLKENFDNPKTLFHHNVVKDYRRISYGK